MMRAYEGNNGHHRRLRDDDDDDDRRRMRDDWDDRDRDDGRWMRDTRDMRRDRDDRRYEAMPGARAEYRPRLRGNTVASVWEITAQSRDSFEDAIRYGIERARRTLRHIRGVWVQGQEVLLRNNEIYAFRVQLKLTYVLDDH